MERHRRLPRRLLAADLAVHPRPPQSVRPLQASADLRQPPERQHRRRHRPAALPQRRPAGLQVEHDLLAALDAALRRLPPRQRSVWILKEVEDFTYAQIATVMATTPDAVRGLLERARTGLAITLKEWR
ncbi:sigma factor-like helix-turn-helix DNA-binding protein [Actinoplanes subtropicus]|uniref:sigma factor-like helix-turn-helix DNA-binding protein n=1 Tax=Actinoplanes subtropicus TaxID=543632 RepID=UPI003CCBDDB4